MALSATTNGQGSNSAAVRQFNERVVLAALRRLGIRQGMGRPSASIRD